MDAAARAIVSRLAADRTSGASELMADAVEAVRRALPGGADAAEETARAICAAQPAMAPFCNLALAAAAERTEPGALDRFERQWRRAPAALARVAHGMLAPEPGIPVRFVTCSFSGSVLACLRAMAGTNPVHVTCGEGRPLLEGRRMAAALAAGGIQVEVRTDAALAGALAGCDGLLVGADAVTPAWFLNKCGTWQLAAAAGLSGAAVYVLATRDKFVDLPVGDSLRIGEHDPREVWDAAPAGVTVSNPYFERVALGLVTALITDAGVRAGP
jgi:hypothetical protein